jgi:hypothetical protein
LKIASTEFAMFPWSIRPTFQIQLSASREDAIVRFEVAMSQQTQAALYLTHGEYAEFHLEDELHRLWSPHLSIYFLPATSETHCELFGRFAPRPNIWTLVWIFYLAFFCCIFFASIFGGSQWMIGHFPWGLAIAAATMVLYLGLFLASQIGQSLCHDQMELLRNRLDNVLFQAGLEVHKPTS